MYVVKDHDLFNRPPHPAARHPRSHKHLRNLYDHGAAHPQCGSPHTAARRTAGAAADEVRGGGGAGAVHAVPECGGLDQGHEPKAVVWARPQAQGRVHVGRHPRGRRQSGQAVRGLPGVDGWAQQQRVCGTAGRFKATDEAEWEKGSAGDPRTTFALKKFKILKTSQKWLATKFWPSGVQPQPRPPRSPRSPCSPLTKHFADEHATNNYDDWADYPADSWCQAPQSLKLGAPPEKIRNSERLPLAHRSLSPPSYGIGKTRFVDDYAQITHDSAVFPEGGEDGEADSGAVCSCDWNRRRVAEIDKDRGVHIPGDPGVAYAQWAGTLGQHAPPRQRSSSSTVLMGSFPPIMRPYLAHRADSPVAHLCIRVRIRVLVQWLAHFYARRERTQRYNSLHERTSGLSAHQRGQSPSPQARAHDRPVPKAQHAQGASVIRGHAVDGARGFDCTACGILHAWLKNKSTTTNARGGA
ncbi:hypothetical protein C8J57DRAFT_1260398 [Mycena rebaudengoi]|nr:hypothetical protein C8J57DRAFT_1260398 [Mycena rebaudengoi]